MVRQQKICVRVPVEWLSAMDKHRGEASRSIYVRQVLSRALRKSEDVDGRGKWDRIEYGLMRPDRAEAELRRRARNERRRQQPKRPKPLPPPPTFEFHPTGQVTSSDLDPLATFVGFVTDAGDYLPESTRYSRDRVRAELLKQMESEPERSWPERYRLFLERSGLVEVFGTVCGDGYTRRELT